MKKQFILLGLATILSLLAVHPVFADTNCQSIYGGGENCGTGNLSVEKQVVKPGTSDQFVDNLGTNDAHFQPLSPIFFRFIVKNTSNTQVNNIVVKDTIDNTHEFVDFVSGPGNFDKTSKTLTYSINTLKPGEQSTVTISGRIVNAANLPANQQVVCVTNAAEASADNSQPTQATSEFCIDNPQNTGVTATPPQNQTKGGLPVQNQNNPSGGQTGNASNNQGTNQAQNQSGNLPVFSPSNTIQRSPKSGPEALPLLAMIPTGALGMWLRKKAK